MEETKRQRSARVKAALSSIGSSSAAVYSWKALVEENVIIEQADDEKSPYSIRWCDKCEAWRCHSRDGSKCKTCVSRETGLGNPAIHAKTIKSQIENGTFNMMDPEVQRSKSSNANLKLTIEKHWCDTCQAETWHNHYAANDGWLCKVCSAQNNGFRSAWCETCKAETIHNGKTCIVCHPEAGTAISKDHIKASTGPGFCVKCGKWAESRSVAKLCFDCTGFQAGEPHSRWGRMIKAPSGWSYGENYLIAKGYDPDLIESGAQIHEKEFCEQCGSKLTYPQERFCSEECAIEHKAACIRRANSYSVEEILYIMENKVVELAESGRSASVDSARFAALQSWNDELESIWKALLEENAIPEKLDRSISVDQIVERFLANEKLFRSIREVKQAFGLLKNWSEAESTVIKICEEQGIPETAYVSKDQETIVEEFSKMSGTVVGMLSRFRGLKNFTPELEEKLTAMAVEMGVPLNAREAFYQQPLSLIHFENEHATVTLEEIDAFAGQCGVWAVCCEDGTVLDVCKTVDIGAEMLSVARLFGRIAEDPDSVEATSSSKTSRKRKFAKMLEDAGNNLVYKIVKVCESEDEASKVEIQFAHDFKARYWSPDPYQKKTIGGE